MFLLFHNFIFSTVEDQLQLSDNNDKILPATETNLRKMG